MHRDEVRVSVDQVRALLADQAPQWADCTVTAVPGAGTVNAIFRIGDGLAARFPLRRADHEQAASRLAAERAAMAEFGVASPFPAPEVLLVGQPGHGYAAAWSVQTWIEGTAPTPTSLQDSDSFAGDLADLISALRQCDTGGRTFDGSNRGGELRSHDAWMQDCIARSEGLADTAAMRRLWNRYRDLPRADPDAMSHTDLIPGNLLVVDGRLVGVIDTGDFRAADPALDLVAAWHLLDESRRAVLRSRLRCDDLQWERGKAWAFEQAAGLVWYYRESNPPMAHLGETTLRRLIDADSPIRTRPG
jgi:aminoglycoside phosphotransferase (APT) family kinase protein